MPYVLHFAFMETQEKYIHYWCRCRDEQHAQNQQLALLARADLQQIVACLVREFGATQIILFGSLARGRFTEGSDIDLAVEGIPPSEYFAALAAVNDLTSLWVDLKPLEALIPHFRRRVLETGELIYAKDNQQ